MIGQILLGCNIKNAAIVMDISFGVVHKGQTFVDFRVQKSITTHTHSIFLYISRCK